MEKEDVAHIYNEVVLSHERKDTGSPMEMWMGLEGVTQSDVSQREKTSIVVLMHVCGIEKDGTDDLTCRAGTEMQDM